MQQFESYYWSPALLKDEALVAAFQALTSDKETEEQKESAFNTLLTSRDTVAVGIALDHFSYAETEHGGIEGRNPYIKFRKVLLAESRRQLKEPPVTAIAPDGDVISGANHASALHLLWREGTVNDLKFIEPVLAESADENVLEIALFAAKAILSKTRKIHYEIIENLKKIIYSEKFSDFTRWKAIEAFSYYRISDAENLLLDIVENCSYPISGYAALALYYRDPQKHQKFLEKAVGKMPEKDWLPAGRLRQLLSEDI